MGLRVALVLEGDLGHGDIHGEASLDALALARGLGPRGIDVEVICPAEIEEAFAGTGAQVRPLSVGVGVAGVSALRRLLRESGVDVIHAEGLRAGLAASLARSGGTPLVVAWSDPIHVNGPAGLARRALARTVAAAADLTLAASTDLVESATKLGARDARLAPVVAPQLPPPSRDPAEVREELGVTGPMVLAVARLHPRSHLDVLVGAAARWRYRRPMPEVVIVGTGPAYRHLVAQAATSRSPVIFAGERDDPADLLAATDIAVITGDRVRPQLAMEAARAGVAVVAPDGGGLVDLLDGAVALVTPHDVDALDDAMRRLLDDPGARSALAAAGRARAEGWPSEADAVGQLAGWYAEIAARDRDAGPADDHQVGSSADRDAPGRHR